MSELESASELEGTTMPNGSGLPLPKDTGGEAASEEKGQEENGVRTVEAERKEEKKDDAQMEGTEYEKVAEAEDSKKVESEDAKMTESEDAKETKAEDVKVEEVEDAKKVEAEDDKVVKAKSDKVAEAEDVRTIEAKEAKMEKAEGRIVMDAEAEKDVDKGEEEGEKEVEREKIEGGNDTMGKKDGVNLEKKVEKKKRMRRGKAGEKGNEKEKKEGKAKDKEFLSTPLASSMERPVRERKTVERLVEALEKEPVKKFLIEKGGGTPLKEIPNVAYKLAKKKPADLKLLHQTLFGGRQGKAADFKNHILQFSGFVWHGDEEKQKTKTKEKLDKCVKDTLVDLCDLFDIPVSKTNTRKEELVTTLMDFLVVPHATTDTVLAEKEEQTVESRMRKRVAKRSASKSLEGTPMKRPRRGISKNEDSLKSKGKSVHEMEEEEEQEDEKNGVPKDNDALKHSESEEIESEEEEEDDDDDDYTGKRKRKRKRPSKRAGSSGAKKLKLVTSPKKAPLPTPTKSPTKSSSKHPKKTEETNDVAAKVFSRKKKNVDVPEKKSTPKSDHREKATGKRVAKGKAKSVAKESAPSKEELRKTICDILKEVDFNTATFTDILKELAKHYSVDLTPTKKTIKLMIQEELTKLANEAEENEEDEEDGHANEDEEPEIVGKEVEA